MPDMKPTDVQVAEGCSMIGRRNPDSVLQCNTYLRTFHGSGTDFHWCVDPGSMMDYSTIRTNLLHHLGDFAALNLVSMNHQDPDVTGNLLNFTRENPQLTGLIAEDAWRRERAALAGTEAVTEVAHGHVPDEVYELARRHFGEKELVDLTLAVVAINGWNRLAISFRKVPGTYQPTHPGELPH